MINILIRTHERPAMFKRCIESIESQVASLPTSYKVAVYVVADSDRSYLYAIQTLKGRCLNHLVKRIHPPQVPNRSKFFYNLYCNELIEMASGKSNLADWLFFLDDDDTLKDGSLKMIARLLERMDAQGDQALICQFLRGGKPKPSNVMMSREEVRSGHIGLPCLFLNASIAKPYFTDTENADYLFIKNYADVATFVKIPVVISEKRGHGKPE